MKKEKEKVGVHYNSSGVNTGIPEYRETPTKTKKLVKGVNKPGARQGMSASRAARRVHKTAETLRKATKGNHLFYNNRKPTRGRHVQHTEHGVIRHNVKQDNISKNVIMTDGAHSTVKDVIKAIGDAISPKTGE